MRGTITTRKTKDGQVRYRAQIRMDNDTVGKFAESRTFSKKSIASEWLRQRIAEIERDPDCINPKTQPKSMMLGEAIEKYQAETDGVFGRSKNYGVSHLKSWPISKRNLCDLTRKDYADHVLLRRAGNPEIGALPIAASTAGQDLHYLRAVLIHAQTLWHETVNINELDEAKRGLSKSRVIARSKVRRRLPTTNELQALTTYFYLRYQRKNSTYPMHLIMWAFIYLCRRDAELCRLKITDFGADRKTVLVMNIKNPDGSEGNDKMGRIPDIAQPVIDDLLVARKKGGHDDDDRLVPFDPKSVSAYFARACKILGIDDLRLHDLRHEGATRLAEDGLTIPQIQQVTLHESWSSLQVYVDVTPRGERLDYLDAMRVAKAE